MKQEQDIRKRVEFLAGAADMLGTYAGYTIVNGMPGSVIWGHDEDGWEHVSFSPMDKSYIPSWDDMCELKRIFWKASEPVIQFIPAENEHVNIVPNCMHLWAPKDPVIRKGLNMPIGRERTEDEL